MKEFVALAPRKRGRKPVPVNPLDRENVELKRALAKAEARATRADALVELQKEVSQLLGIPQPGGEDETP